MSGFYGCGGVFISDCWVLIVVYCFKGLVGNLVIWFFVVLYKENWNYYDNLYSYVEY